jgi:hypothetical protein
MRVLIAEDDDRLGRGQTGHEARRAPGRQAVLEPYRGAGSVAVVSTRDRLVVNA